MITTAEPLLTLHAASVPRYLVSIAPDGRYFVDENPGKEYTVIRILTALHCQGVNAEAYFGDETLVLFILPG